MDLLCVEEGCTEYARYIWDGYSYCELHFKEESEEDEGYEESEEESKEELEVNNNEHNY